MATFNWEIYDASDEPVPDLYGGEVELKEVQPTKGRPWEIQPPDPEVALEPIASGAVNICKGPTQEVRKASTDRTFGISSLSADKRLFRLVVLIVLVLLGCGFITVVVNDVRQGKLDFQTYTMFLSSFLAGLGVGKVSKSTRTEQGDGSG
jgi:hypothetical protein